MRFIINIFFIIIPTISFSLTYKVEDYKGWEFVTYSEHMHFFYVDPSSIRIQGTFRGFRELVDFAFIREGANSRITWILADCEKLRVKEIGMKLYNQKGGKGEEIASYDFYLQEQQGWMDVSRLNTVGNLIINYVCFNKKEKKISNVMPLPRPNFISEIEKIVPTPPPPRPNNLKINF